MYKEFECYNEQASCHVIFTLPFINIYFVLFIRGTKFKYEIHSNASIFQFRFSS